MRPGTIVVALGGNAMAPPDERPTIGNQFRHTRASLAAIVELAGAGWCIAIVHGNGPQVGNELARNEIASGEVEPLPLGVLVAGTAGWMGYMIQQSLQNALAHAGVDRTVVTLIAQTLCDADDPNLGTATKPIGHGAWRRLVPSPRPVAVVERDTVRELVGRGHIVITCGGGGPPVRRAAAAALEGIEAVVDKDRVAAILGRDIGAQTLLILTNVPAVYEAYGTPDQRPIPYLTLAAADALLRGNALGSGSMRPKVEAAFAFVEQTGGEALVTSAEAIRNGEAGTRIVPASGS